MRDIDPRALKVAKHVKAANIPILLISLYISIAVIAPHLLELVLPIRIATIISIAWCIRYALTVLAVQLYVFKVYGSKNYESFISDSKHAQRVFVYTIARKQLMKSIYHDSPPLQFAPFEVHPKGTDKKIIAVVRRSDKMIGTLNGIGISESIDVRAKGNNVLRFVYYGVHQTPSSKIPYDCIIINGGMIYRLDEGVPFSE